MRLTLATGQHAAAMAKAHAGAFDPAWREDEFEDLLEGEGIFGFVAHDDGAADAPLDSPLGVILCRVAADEVEVLTLGVTPKARRQGVGKALMAASLEVARQLGARECLLEVAVDNEPASKLYEGLGFQRTGLRRGYYDRGEAGPVDALVMRLDLSAA